MPARTQDELGAAKQRQRALLAAHFGIPDLGGAPGVAALGVADQDAVDRGGEKVGFELERGEAHRGVGDSREGAVAAGGVGERDERSGVQIAGGGKQLGTDS